MLNVLNVQEFQKEKQIHSIHFLSPVGTLQDLQIRKSKTSKP